MVEGLQMHLFITIVPLKITTFTVQLRGWKLQLCQVSWVLVLGNRTKGTAHRSQLTSCFIHHSSTRGINSASAPLSVKSWVFIIGKTMLAKSNLKHFPLLKGCSNTLLLEHTLFFSPKVTSVQCPAPSKEPQSSSWGWEPAGGDQFIQMKLSML